MSNLSFIADSNFFFSMLAIKMLQVACFSDSKQVHNSGKHPQLHLCKTWLLFVYYSKVGQKSHVLHTLSLV